MNREKTDIFGVSSEGTKNPALSENPEDFANVIAELPECQPAGNAWKEYKDYPEERVWNPITPIGETCMPLFLFMARSALTCAQERQGIPNAEALENSCSGTAEQYISDVFHDSSYIPEVALKRLVTKEFPEKLVDRWSTSDIALFGKGLNTYGKKFELIRADLFPHKRTMDLVEFYYTWKRSKEIKGLVASRARRFLRRRSKPSNLIIGSPAASGMVTRGQLAAVETSGTPADKVRNSRKDVYTAVKRKRRTLRQIRNRLISV